MSTGDGDAGAVEDILPWERADGLIKAAEDFQKGRLRTVTFITRSGWPRVWLLE